MSPPWTCDILSGRSFFCLELWLSLESPLLKGSLSSTCFPRQIVFFPTFASWSCLTYTGANKPGSSSESLCNSSLVSFFEYLFGRNWSVFFIRALICWHVSLSALFSPFSYFLLLFLFRFHSRSWSIGVSSNCKCTGLRWLQLAWRYLIDISLWPGHSLPRQLLHYLTQQWINPYSQA